MMLEPVVNSVGSVKYPNSGIENRIRSCASRDSVSITCASAESWTDSILPRPWFAFSTLCTGASKPSRRAVSARSISNGTP